MMNLDNIRSLSSKKARLTYLHHYEAGNFFANNGKTFENLPPFTRARFVMKPGKGSYIVTEIWLPDEENWNGRFIGLGNGGMAGAIRYERLAEWLSGGYACANTDLGTSRGEASGALNPDVWADFGWRATHLMTEYGKKAVRKYYGRSARYSYFSGASTGGEQAFSEAERFPKDYDGIYAGVAAFHRVSLHVYFLWVWEHLSRPNGIPVFSEEEAALITRLSVEFLRENGDGEPGDAFATVPYCGEDTAERFVAFAAGRYPFTEAQKKALLAVTEGPKNRRTGKRIYCGVPLGAGAEPGEAIRSFSGPKCGYLYPFRWAFGMDYNVRSFDFAADMDLLREKISADLDADSADLSAFRDSGGKMITYSGTADNLVPYPETVSYYDRAAERLGGYEALGEFFRFYILPGRAHHGGPGTETFCLPGDTEGGDAFSALVRWVEEGIAPEEMTAVRAANPDDPGKKTFTRTVYPYGLSEKCPQKTGNTQPGSEYTD